MKRVVITGASRGLGLALATHYLEAGETVYGTVRSANTAVTELSAKYPDTFHQLTVDVQNDQSVRSAAAFAAEQADSVDIVICNAGVNPSRTTFELQTVPELSDEELLNTFDINVVGVVRTIRAFYDLLTKSADPRLMIMTSGVGSLSNVNDGWLIPYSVSKTALNMLGERLRHVVKGDGVKVILLNPGWVKTDMGGSEAQMEPGPAAAAIAERIAEHNEQSPHYVNYDGAEIPW